MKKFLIGALALVCFLGTVSFVSCGGEENPSTSSVASNSSTNSSVSSGSTPVEITGVEFTSKEYVYDGTERTLTATGIPVGVQASYAGNKGTNAGTYSASVTLSGEGYITKTLTATLTIKKKDITDVSLAQDSEVDYTGERLFPTLNGELPANAQMTWRFNDVVMNDGVKDPDEYAVELKITALNYNDLTLTATFTIKPDYAKMAADVIKVFNVKPDPWAYLPESLSIENKKIEQVDVPTENAYSSFVNISSIPSNYIGQQLDVVYDVLTVCDVALGYVTKVNGALNTIQQAYQIFLNSNPVNQGEFFGTVMIGDVACNYAIVLDEGVYTLTVNVSGVEVYLFGDVATNDYGARVQITENNAIKYEVADNKLTIALNVVNSYTTYIEFLKEGTNTLGYIYQYIGAAGVSMTKSALLKVDENHTTVVGTMGDFIPTADGRNCEVYRNSDGQMVGTEVSESLEKSEATFDTLWYNLRDIQGISSIKKEDKANGINPDTIYINGNTDTIHTKLAGFSSGLQAGSRRFDIEFKEVCAYVYNESEQKYKQVTFEVPMMFIQEKFVEDFEADFADKNKIDKTPITVTLVSTAADKQAVDSGYHILVNAYNAIKDTVTQQMIADFCKK